MCAILVKDEAKKDLARLAEIKARREAAKKKKEDEKKAEEAAAAATKAAAAAADDDDDSSDDSEVEELDMREIKKMKPPTLKEHLKKRGLSTQGNKKDLIKRLTDACSK